jgi:DedD protein
MSDSQPREIQLGGKQLVFLFMAATVVSVVIFLCGVLVGRGVRAQVNAIPPEAASFGGVPGATTAIPPKDNSATPDVPATAAPPASAGSNTPLTYYDRLDAKKPLPETLKTPAPATANGRGATTSTAAEEASTVPTPARDERPAPAATEDAALAPPSGSGYAVQVAALRNRHEAEIIARRLLGKGYRAYVISPTGGRPAVFRVRVGKFQTRAEAQRVATRLRKEEQFKPWITR